MQFQGYAAPALGVLVYASGVHGEGNVWHMTFFEISRPWHDWLTSWPLTGSAADQQCLQLQAQVLPTGQPQTMQDLVGRCN